MKSLVGWIAILYTAFYGATAMAKVHSMIIAQDPEKVSIYLDEQIPGLNLPGNQLLILNSDFQSGGRYEGLPNPVSDLTKLKPFLIAYAERLKQIALKKNVQQFIERHTSLDPMIETEELGKSVELNAQSPERLTINGLYDVAAKLAE